MTNILEDNDKHVTFCFGRMNPPTIGHKAVFDTMKRQGGDYFIFLGQTQDSKKNPLDFKTKIDFIKKIHPEYASKIIDEPNIKTPVQAASYLYDQGYRHATFVGGDDRKQMYEMIKSYNGVKDKPHGFYDFEILDFESAGAREDDSEGLAGISATKAREAAVGGNLEEFTKATGAGEHAEDLYNAVREGMGVKESVTESNLVLNRNSLIDYIKDAILDYIETENDIEKLGNLLKQVTGKRIIDTDGKRFTITKEDIISAFTGLKENKIKKNPVAKNMEKFNRPQTHTDRKKAMKAGELKHKKSYTTESVDKKVAELGRILMDKAVEQKDEKLSGIMSTVGSELTKFGALTGARDIADLEKRAGVPLDMIKKLMDYANKFQDTSLEKVKDPEGIDDEEDTNESGNQRIERSKINSKNDVRQSAASVGQTDVAAEAQIEVPESQSQKYGIGVIQMLEAIVRDKQAKEISFQDGKSKVDMFTASAVTQVFNSVNDKNKKKIIDMIGNRAGFIKIADFAMSQVGRKEGVGESNHDRDPSDDGDHAEREMAESQLEFIKYACDELEQHFQQFPMPEWFQNKLSRIHGTMMSLHAYIEGQEGKYGLNDSVEEGKQKGVDGKACWDGYKRMGTKKKGGKTVDNCVPMTAAEKNK